MQKLPSTLKLEYCVTVLLLEQVSVGLVVVERMQVVVVQIMARCRVWPWGYWGRADTIV